MPTSIFRGFAFPFSSSSLSFPAGSTDDDLIHDSIVQLVLTMRCERVMRPDLGCNAYSFIFENEDDVLAELIRTEVMAVISRYEPRVAVSDVTVERDDTTSSMSSVLVTIKYVVLATRTPGTAEVRFS